jgi:drug/metabolite transporter (DMT)-like permease
MDPRLLMRISLLARRRTSKARFITVTIAVVGALLIFAADKYGLAPDWMSVERMRFNP